MTAKPVRISMPIACQRDNTADHVIYKLCGKCIKIHYCVSVVLAQIVTLHAENYHIIISYLCCQEAS